MRIRLARFLLRVGEFVQSLAVVVMKPDDLVEFSRQTYARPQNVKSFAEDAVVDSGLSKHELDLLAAVPVTSGALLLLGVGGGREAIPFARMGFQVTGVDYVAAMVDRAREQAARRGVHIEGLVQDICRLDVPAGAFDVVWLSTSLYSSVPTRARRVEMVRRIAQALKPGGWFFCQFRWRAGRTSSAAVLLRRVVAVLTLGNLEYEAGDMLWRNGEFLHAFTSEDAVRAELEEGGLSVLRFQMDPVPMRGAVVCRKSPETGPNAPV